MAEGPTVEEQARQELQKIAKSIGRIRGRIGAVQDYLPEPSKDSTPGLSTLHAVCEDVAFNYLDPARERLDRIARMTEEDLRRRRITYEVTASLAASALALMPEEHMKDALTRLATIPPMDWLRMLFALRRDTERRWLEQLVDQRGGEQPT